MKLSVSVHLNLRAKEVNDAAREAARQAMRDTVVLVAGDAINLSPIKTGNNRRSIKYEASGFGQNEMVDANAIEGAVYSTSGYGGYLETGTYKMAARPYFRPALDMHFTLEKFTALLRGYLK